jgi:hypothetical protein
MSRTKGDSARSIKPEVVKALRKKLKDLPNVNELGLSKADAVRELRSEIEELRTTKGYTYKKIAEICSESGVIVSAPTIKAALASANGEAINSAAAPSKKR